jgi:hypothetical protein
MCRPTSERVAIDPTLQKSLAAVPPLYGLVGVRCLTNHSVALFCESDLLAEGRVERAIPMNQ